MKNKLIFLLIWLAAVFAGAVQVIDEDQYLVKPGDKFLIEVVTIDTVQVMSPVLPSGYLSLHPVGPSVYVAGQTLHSAKKMAFDMIQKRFPQSLISVELGEPARTRFHLTGAVRAPGQFTSEPIPTLFEALLLGKGLLPQASRKVTVIRGSDSQVYDLQKYLIDGDVSQNPLIQDGDRIEATFAENYLRIYAYNDTTLVPEYYEMDQSMSIRRVMQRTLFKHPTTQYSSMRVIRDGQVQDADLDFEVRAGDALYLATEENAIYVTGYVLRPGKYVYNGPRDYSYYINLAGGFSTVGSQSRLRIITPDGRTRKKSEALQPGDTIQVPEASWFLIRDNLSTITTVAVIIYYISQITK
jgi:protein involved in polysaccharide export with SLBB domain